MQVLLDELVRPPNPITDYLTQHSGITPAMMEGVITTLADVQVPLVDDDGPLLPQFACQETRADVEAHL